MNNSFKTLIAKILLISLIISSNSITNFANSIDNINNNENQHSLLVSKNKQAGSYYDKWGEVLFNYEHKSKKLLMNDDNNNLHADFTVKERNNNINDIISSNIENDDYIVETVKTNNNIIDNENEFLNIENENNITIDSIHNNDDMNLKQKEDGFEDVPEELDDILVEDINDEIDDNIQIDLKDNSLNNFDSDNENEDGVVSKDENDLNLDDFSIIDDKNDLAYGDLIDNLENENIDINEDKKEQINNEKNVELYISTISESVYEDIELDNIIIEDDVVSTNSEIEILDDFEEIEYISSISEIATKSIPNMDFGAGSDWIFDYTWFDQIKNVLQVENKSQIKKIIFKITTEIPDDTIIRGCDLNVSSVKHGTAYYMYDNSLQICFVPGYQKVNSNASSLFNNFDNITEIIGLDLLNWGECNNIEEMFSGCNNLSSVDLSYVKMTNINSTKNLFYNCSNITNIIVNDNTDLSNITNYESMFYGCEKLASVSNLIFNSQNVQNMKQMFFSCKNLKSIDLSNIKTSNITSDAFLGMFNNCSNLNQIEFGDNFNIDNATNLSDMFNSCSSIKILKLKNFNSNHITNVDRMFKDCSNLETIYVNENFNLVNITGNDMFLNCDKLIGSEGTSYQNKKITNSNFATIDKGDTEPGYFTNYIHKHYICGTTLYGHCLHNGIELHSELENKNNYLTTFEEIYKDNSNDSNTSFFPKTEGSFVLMEDVEYNGTNVFTLTGNLYICLNGHSFKYKTNEIKQSNTLYICNCSKYEATIEQTKDDSIRFNNGDRTFIISYNAPIKFLFKRVITGRVNDNIYLDFLYFHNIDMRPNTTNLLNQNLFSANTRQGIVLSSCSIANFQFTNSEYCGLFDSFSMNIGKYRLYGLNVNNCGYKNNPITCLFSKQCKIEIENYLNINNCCFDSINQNLPNQNVNVYNQEILFKSVTNITNSNFNKLFKIYNKSKDDIDQHININTGEFNISNNNFNDSVFTIETDENDFDSYITVNLNKFIFANNIVKGSLFNKIKSNTKSFDINVNNLIVSTNSFIDNNGVSSIFNIEEGTINVNNNFDKNKCNIYIFDNDSLKFMIRSLSTNQEENANLNLKANIVEFSNNTTNSNFIYAAGFSNVNINPNRFNMINNINNKGITDKSGLIMTESQNSVVNILAEKSLIKNNQTINGIIHLNNGKIVIKNIVFEDNKNTDTSNGGIIYTAKDTKNIVQLENVEIKNHTRISDNIFSVYGTTQLEMKNIQIYNNNIDKRLINADDINVQIKFLGNNNIYNNKYSTYAGPWRFIYLKCDNIIFENGDTVISNNEPNSNSGAADFIYINSISSGFNIKNSQVKIEKNKIYSLNDDINFITINDDNTNINILGSSGFIVANNTMEVSQASVNSKKSVLKLKPNQNINIENSFIQIENNKLVGSMIDENENHLYGIYKITTYSNYLEPNAKGFINQLNNTKLKANETKIDSIYFDNTDNTGFIYNNWTNENIENYNENLYKNCFIEDQYKNKELFVSMLNNDVIIKKIHLHKTCGSLIYEDCNHEGIGSHNITTYSSINTFVGITLKGSYCLIGDVSEIKILSLVGDLYLCLNGFSLQNVSFVGNGHTVYITNCKNTDSDITGNMFDELFKNTNLEIISSKGKIIITADKLLDNTTDLDIKNIVFCNVNLKKLTNINDFKYSYININKTFNGSNSNLVNMILSNVSINNYNSDNIMFDLNQTNLFFKKVKIDNVKSKNIVYLTKDNNFDNIKIDIDDLEISNSETYEDLIYLSDVKNVLINKLNVNNTVIGEHLIQFMNGESILNIANSNFANNKSKKQFLECASCNTTITTSSFIENEVKTLINVIKNDLTLSNVQIVNNTSTDVFPLIIMDNFTMQHNIMNLKNVNIQNNIVDSSLIYASSGSILFDGINIIDKNTTNKTDNTNFISAQYINIKSETNITNNTIDTNIQFFVNIKESSQYTDNNLNIEDNSLLNINKNIINERFDGQQSIINANNYNIGNNSSLNITENEIKCEITPTEKVAVMFIDKNKSINVKNSKINIYNNKTTGSKNKELNNLLYGIFSKNTDGFIKQIENTKFVASESNKKCSSIENIAFDNNNGEGIIYKNWKEETVVGFDENVYKLFTAATYINNNLYVYVEDYNVKIGSFHSHKICGEDKNTNCNHIDIGEHTYENGGIATYSILDINKQFPTKGYYFINENIDITNARFQKLKLPEVRLTGDLYLCLNGYDIKGIKFPLSIYTINITNCKTNETTIESNENDILFENVKTEVVTSKGSINLVSNNVINITTQTNYINYLKFYNVKFKIKSNEIKDKYINIDRMQYIIDFIVSSSSIANIKTDNNSNIIYANATNINFNNVVVDNINSNNFIQTSYYSNNNFKINIKNTNLTNSIFNNNIFDITNIDFSIDNVKINNVVSNENFIYDNDTNGTINMVDAVITKSTMKTMLKLESALLELSNILIDENTFDEKIFDIEKLNIKNKVNIVNNQIDNTKNNIIKIDNDLIIEDNSNLTIENNIISRDVTNSIQSILLANKYDINNNSKFEIINNKINCEKIGEGVLSVLYIDNNQNISIGHSSINIYGNITTGNYKSDIKNHLYGIYSNNENGFIKQKTSTKFIATNSYVDNVAFGNDSGRGIIYTNWNSHTIDGYNDYLYQKVFVADILKSARLSVSMNNSNVVIDSLHRHKLCGVDVEVDCNHKNISNHNLLNNGIATYNNLINLQTSLVGGYYYIDKNYDNMININLTSDLYICLNGYNITNINFLGNGHNVYITNCQKKEVNIVGLNDKPLFDDTNVNVITSKGKINIKAN